MSEQVDCTPREGATMVEHAAVVEHVAMVERGSEPVMVETTPATVGEPIEPNLAD